MGNCSTEQQQVSQPISSTVQQMPIPQTEIKKPQPTNFQIPKTIGQIRQQYQSQPTCVLAKTTIMPTNPQQSQQIKQLKSLKPGTMFTDHIFKTEKKSIGDKLVLQHLEWKRPKQLLREQPVFFEDDLEEMEGYELKQGRLENSYFVSAFALLGNNFQRFMNILSRVFDGKMEVSENGSYVLWLFIDGYWRQILIDDQIPTVFNQYIFSNYKKQLWIWLLQKALAKYFKSYQNIQKGQIGFVLTALTGCPSIYMNTKSSQPVDPDTAWQFIRSNMSLGYPMCISTECTDRNKYFTLEPTFSYTILDSQQVYILTSTKKKLERILKLDNPWGRYQWKGRWSQYSDVWSEELRHQLDYEKADQSIMWINVEDLVKHFGQVCVCKYEPQYINTTLTLKFKQTQDNQLKGIFINLTNRTQGHLSLIQKDYRNYFKNYKYSMCKLILLQLQPQGQKQPGPIKPKSIITQKLDVDAYCTIPIELNPGIYYLIIEMDWTCSFTREVMLNLNADHGVNFVQDMNMPSGDSLFYELAIMDQKDNQNVQVYTYPHDPNIKRISAVFGGYVYYHYINNSTDNKYLSQTVKLGDSKNLAIAGQKSPDQYAIKLLPGQQKIIKMKITAQGTGDYTFKPVIKNQVFQRYSQQNLLSLLKKKPTKVRQRDIDGQKIEVWVKTFEYSGGVALLYVNDMSKHSFIQEITFGLTNLVLDQQTLQEDGKYNIQLQPHTQKMLSFLIIDPSKSFTFKTKVQYYLGTPEFKF